MSHPLTVKIKNDTGNDLVLDPGTPPDSRTANIGNYRIDKVSGEIYGKYISAPFDPEPIPAQQQCGIPRTTYNTDQHLHLTSGNSGNVVNAELRGTASTLPITTVEVSCTKPRRGPKPKIRLSPHVAIIKVAIGERAHWIEQAVMAGIYIAVESNNGKLNIKPGLVRKVLTLPVISTDTIARHSAFRNHDLEPVSPRYVRYLAAAGRVALGCIERHLGQHPDEQQRLEAKVLAPSGWGEEFDLEEGDYIEAQ